MKAAVPVIAFLLLWQLGFSQDQSQIPAQGTAIESPRRQPCFQLLYHTGVYWSRTEYLSGQFADGYRAIDARLGFQTDGSALWQQYHHHPRYGLGIHYADLVKDRNDTIVGNPFSAFAFYSEPWARFWFFTLSTDMAIGLSYTSLVHDPETNPWNDVIASHINLFFDFCVNLDLQLTERLDLRAGYGVTHYSNGGIHQPQKGVNNWGWTFGLNYHFNGPGSFIKDAGPENGFKRMELLKTDRPEFSPTGEFQFMLAAGTVEWQPLGEPVGAYYFTSSVTADYALRTRYRSAVALGLDVLYDGSLELAIKGIPPERVTTFQKTYLGGHIGYQYIIDRITLVFNLGTYFLQHSYDRGFIFSRLGGRIRLTDHLHAQVSIKTKNGVRSDWIEWGLVTSLRTR
jgi:hypothetical protein